MALRHVGVTQRQWDDTWNKLQPQNRLFPVSEPRHQHGYICVVVGELLVWTDQYIPEGYWDRSVEEEVVRVNTALFREQGRQLVEAGKRKSLMSFQERVVAEKEELGENAVRLASFLRSSLFTTIPEAEQERLTRQLRIMDEYCQVLDERIAAFAPAG